MGGGSFCVPHSLTHSFVLGCVRLGYALNSDSLCSSVRKSSLLAPKHTYLYSHTIDVCAWHALGILMVGRCPAPPDMVIAGNFHIQARLVRHRVVPKCVVIKSRVPSRSCPFLFPVFLIGLLASMRSYTLGHVACIASALGCT